MTSSVWSWESVENAMTTRWTAFLADEPGEIVRRSDQWRLAVAIRDHAVVPVDITDDAQPVFGMLVDLVGEHMGHFARADDDDVLDYAAWRRPIARATGAEHGTRTDREQPEDDEALQVRVGKPDEAA